MNEPIGQTFPRLVTSGMDNSFFWQSHEEYAAGDIIEHRGRSYRVLYSWAWIDAYGLYAAELEPVEPLNYESRLTVEGSPS